MSHASTTAANREAFDDLKARAGTHSIVVSLDALEVVTFGLHTVALMGVNGTSPRGFEALLQFNASATWSLWRNRKFFHESVVDPDEGPLALSVASLSVARQRATLELLVPADMAVSAPFRPMDCWGWRAIERRYRLTPHSSWLMEWRRSNQSPFGAIDPDRLRRMVEQEREAIRAAGATLDPVNPPQPLWVMETEELKHNACNP